MKPDRRLLVCAVVGCWSICGCSAGAKAGPLQGDGPLGSGGVSGLQVDAPQVVAFGYNVLENPAVKPITNIHAALIERTKTSLVTSYVGTKILELNGDGGPNAVAKWPGPDIPINKTVDATNYVFRPGSTIELVVLVSVRGSGSVTWPAVRVTYRYEDHNYAITLRNGFNVCAPTTVQCP